MLVRLGRDTAGQEDQCVLETMPTLCSQKHRAPAGRSCLLVCAFVVWLVEGEWENCPYQAFPTARLLGCVWFALSHGDIVLNPHHSHSSLTGETPLMWFFIRTIGLSLSQPLFWILYCYFMHFKIIFTVFSLPFWLLTLASNLVPCEIRSHYT